MIIFNNNKATPTNRPIRRKVPVTEIRVETRETSKIFTATTAPETTTKTTDNLCFVSILPKTFIVDSDYINKKIEFYVRVQSKLSQNIDQHYIIWDYPVEHGHRRKVVPLYDENEPVYYEFINSTIILTVNLVNETYINNYTLKVFGTNCNEIVSIKRNVKQQ